MRACLAWPPKIAPLAGVCTGRSGSTASASTRRATRWPSATRLFERDGDRLTARLSRFQVGNGHALAGEPVDADGLAALDALEQVMNGADLAAEFRFEPGQIQIVNNCVMAHRRTAFRD
jgi:hypothetical protein